MKKISAKLFFTVLWRGLCQALGWFFGLFGYKRDGKFAKCVWGLFATSAAVVMLIIAGALVYVFWDEVARKWEYMHYYCCDNPYCYENNYIKDDIYFHRMDNGKGFVYNIQTGEKFVKHVAWIAEPIGDDSLVCFSNGKKRGYFSMNTGKVVIEPKYDHAWVFSEGLACVDDGGYIKIIDATGKVIIDMKQAYEPDMEGYFFHGGYCVICTEDGEQSGLMDKTGKMVLPMEYNSIYPADDYKFWCVQKGDEMAAYNSDMKPIVPFTKCTLYIDEGTIDMTMPDHTIRKLDYNGNLIHDFYICSVRMLEYEKEEILHQRPQNEIRGDDNDVYFLEIGEPYHPKATARLRAYVAGDGYEGLMTADGHVVMMPTYKDIEAIGYDLYLCTSTNYDKVIVNGRGEVVR